MTSIHSVVKSKKDDVLKTNVDVSLKELQVEAKSLFGVLDKSSNLIRKMESCLCELKAHFPFRYYIAESTAFDKGDQRRILKEKTCLSWEQADDSKHFRLFLFPRK